MKKNTIQLVFSLLACLSLAACSAINSLQQPGSAALAASGTIEADVIHLGPEIGGRLLAISAERGEELEAGQEVFRLDDSAWQAQLQQAGAALQAAQAAQAAAQANLELLQAGPTPQQVQAAQAQADQAQANFQALQANLWAATAGARPEEIRAAQARLDFARQEYYSMTVSLSAGQVEDVHLALTQASSNRAQAQERQDQLAADKRTPPAALDVSAATLADAQGVLNQATLVYQAVQDASLPFYRQSEAMRTACGLADLNLAQERARQTSLQGVADLTQAARDAAQSAVNDAQSLVDKCQAALDSLSNGDGAGRLNSAWSEVQNAQTALNRLARTAAGGASLESLLSQLDAAAAQQEAARASLANLQSGARSQQIDAAQAQVDAAAAQAAAAQAAVDLIHVQIGKLTVKAPLAGVVLDRPFNPGEIAPAGATVVELGSLDKVTLTVYVPEDQYGRIKLGQSAQITVDSFPGKSFDGTVEFISDQAEFTPRNVQTVESRSTTVYAVKIGLQNPEHQLKPGMPADAEFAANP